MLATLDHCFDRAGVAKVGSIVKRLRSRQFLKLKADALDLGGITEAVDHHARALGGHRLCDGKPDSGGRPGYERRLALKLHTIVSRCELLLRRTAAIATVTAVEH